MVRKESDSGVIRNHEERECSQVPELSLVIPLYNEMDNVEPLYQAISDCLNVTEYNFELIFVDDGSEDHTLPKLETVIRRDPRVRVLRLLRNFGQTAAMQIGIEHARGEIIVTLDGDLQNDPRDIPLLVSKVKEGYDLVTGWRRDRKDRFVSRRLPSLVANWCISRFLGLSGHDLGCTLKAFRAELIHRIPLYSDLHRFIPAICSMASTRIEEVIVRHHPRRHGKTKYGISRTWRVVLDALTVKMLLSCAQRPLHWFGYWALPLLLLACLSGLRAAFFTLNSGGNSDYVLPGVAIMLGYLGVNMLFSGIFGEIVVRSEPQERIPVLVDTKVLIDSKRPPIDHATQ